MAVLTFTKTGTKSTTPAKLNKDIFSVEVKNHQLLKDAYLAYLANGRSNVAITKKRGQVSGGGRKPWRQKGTGRARAGSTRSPLWRGGGITFGPTGNENYSRHISTVSKRLAVKQALSLAATADKVMIIEQFNTAGKSKTAASILAKIGAKGKVVLAVDNKDQQITLATRNLEGVKTVQAKYLNVFDILNADFIVLDKDALATIDSWLGKPAKASTQTKEAKSE